MRLGVFQGNLGRDWNVKELSGTKVAENSLAVYVGREGEKTMWVNLSVWGEKQIERVTAWAKKGDKLLVTGDVDIRAYTGNDGEPKAALSCRVDKFDLLFSGKKEEDSPAASKSLSDELEDSIGF